MAETLPHWEETPADIPGAIRRIKSALRARIHASGRTVDEVFAVVSRQLEAEVREIEAARDRGEPVWPVIDYADIAAGAVPTATRDLLRRRGCVVVRGHFGRDQALGWDRELVDYVDRTGRAGSSPATSTPPRAAPSAWLNSARH